ncbi:aminotransferase class III-fold pyridoxal phosphate-dependent enzyme [Desulfogranum mediterraneum]|uniref:aminotransferase class III-fold pyridoxal phosphate-dependent enzyme n=1 Tax=Desulfogranum mediterraneum TaxID=160661 RepID=UPI0003FC1E9F|nr:aminotransferase class III-fold pyridoxal phosphate-dependent enzyme [Desulfogranum mediterraneum]
MKTGALVQARMGATRLPGKVLMELGKEPVLQHVVKRVSRSKLVDEVLVATTIEPGDLPVVGWCAAQSVRVYCGSEEDVLDRFYHTARLAGLDVIVRITADCPFIDPEVIDLVITRFIEGDFDYVNNCGNESWPDGLDVEVFSFKSLEKAWKSADLLSEREHVTPFIYNNPSLFKLDVVDHEPSLKGMRWTLDQEEDFTFISLVYNELMKSGDDSFGMKEVLQLLAEQPQLQEINGSIVRNEGYLKSLQKDTMGEKKQTGQELYRKAKKVIPGGTQLLSKRPEMFLPEQWPAYYASAQGCEVQDLDGNVFQDLSYMGVGACILGYADPDVNRAVKNAVDKGSMTTLNVPEEYELAELLVGLHPWSDMVRYTRTGGEAAAVAVRIARAATGRGKILFCGYHGWHDWYLAANLSDDSALDGHLLPGLSPTGVPRHLLDSAYPFNYNDVNGFLQLVDSYKGDVAAVVMEPIRNFDPEPGFFKKVRQVCSDLGIVLIVDEVSAGFRQTIGGAHLLLDFDPDIAVFAKGISNGFPMAAVLGRQSVMAAAQDSFISSTYWTERIGPVAALATINKIIENNVPQHLMEIGRKVQNGWRQMGKVNGVDLEVGGIPPLAHFSFSGFSDPLACKTLFTQEMLDRGYLATTACYSSLAHTEGVVDNYLTAADEVFSCIVEAEQHGNIQSLLKGPVCHGGFKRLS